MEPKIIFEDGDLLILDKPSGWIVNEASTTKGQKVLQSWLAKNFQFPIFDLPETRNGIVHRLDKETSGLIIIAKKIEIFKALQAQFKKRSVQKTYLALVHGKVIPGEGEINISVGRLPWNRQRFGVLPGGRAATTFYSSKDYYFSPQENEHFSLINVFPKTGRTHQIRIHFKHIHHPVVGDSFYAGRKTARQDRTWCPRLFLHATKIAFSHPSSGKEITAQCPLPKELKQALNQLDKDKN